MKKERKKGTDILHWIWWVYNDVNLDEEMDVREANIYISLANKLSAAAKGPEILIMNNFSKTSTK